MASMCLSMSAAKSTAGLKRGAAPKRYVFLYGERKCDYHRATSTPCGELGDGTETGTETGPGDTVIAGGGGCAVARGSYAGSVEAARLAPGAVCRILQRH